MIFAELQNKNMHHIHLFVISFLCCLIIPSIKFKTEANKVIILPVLHVEGEPFAGSL